MTVVPDAYINNFSILQIFSDHKELHIAEAILIKEKSPIINIKYNEMSNVINLYK